MTPPVLLDAPATGAANSLAPGSAPAAPDPVLAAEFASLLGAATVPVAVVSTAAPPGAAPSPDAVLAAVGGEGDKETARSADSEKILDSAADLVTTDPTTIDPLAIVPNQALAIGLVGTPEATRGNIAHHEKPVLIREFPKASPIDLDPEQKSAGDAIDPSLPLPCGGPLLPPVPKQRPDGDGAVPVAHVADITAIAGGAAETATDAGDASPSGSDGQGDPAPLVITDRPDCVLEMKEPPPAGIQATDGGAAAKIEARPLDRSERTRIVHEVIDRVARHVDSLAVTRSKEPLRIQLEPADLGRIVVEVSRESGGLVADMSASDPRVAQALDRHRSELAAGLASRGHAEARVTVHTATNADLSGFDLRRDGGGAQQQNSDGQSQTRNARQAVTSNGGMIYDRVTQRPRARLRAMGLDLEI